MFKNRIHKNITLLIDKIFGRKVYYLDEKYNYIFDNLYLVKNNQPSYFNENRLQISNRYPPELKTEIELFDKSIKCDLVNNIQIQYYGDSLYFCRPFILKHIYDNYKSYPVYDKICILKKDIHNSRIHNTGCIDNNTFKLFLNQEYFDIDPYQYDILEIIWYIRNAKKITISCGNALYSHMPFFKKNQIINVLSSGAEVTNLMNLNLINVSANTIEISDKDYNEYSYNPEFHTHAYFYLRFLEKTCYKIIILDENKIPTKYLKYI